MWHIRHMWPYVTMSFINCFHVTLCDYNFYHWLSFDFMPFISCWKFHVTLCDYPLYHLLLCNLIWLHFYLVRLGKREFAFVCILYWYDVALNNSKWISKDSFSLSKYDQKPAFDGTNYAIMQMHFCKHIHSTNNIDEIACNVFLQHSIYT